MNSLGRDCGRCTDALQAYCRALDAVLESTWDDARAVEARARLDALLFDLDVDVGARAGDVGRARMSGVEAALLQPALSAARVALEAIAPRDPPGRWRGPLQSAIDALHSVVPDLAAWQSPAAEPPCDTPLAGPAA
jgi:hypothetical protein